MYREMEIKHCEQWFIALNLSKPLSLIACGNTRGKIFIYSLLNPVNMMTPAEVLAYREREANDINDKRRDDFEGDPVLPSKETTPLYHVDKVLSHSNCNSTIRHVVFSPPPMPNPATARGGASGGAAARGGASGGAAASGGGSAKNEQKTKKLHKGYLLACCDDGTVWLWRITAKPIPVPVPAAAKAPSQSSQSTKVPPNQTEKAGASARGKEGGGIGAGGGGGGAGGGAAASGGVIGAKRKKPM